MINIEEEIDVYFRYIGKALADFELYKDILSFSNNDKFKKTSSFFLIVLDSLRLSFVIKTLKLIDKREDKNIFKFLNYIELHQNEFQKGLYRDFTDLDTGKVEQCIIKKVNLQDDINNFREQLDIYQSRIENLKLLRDKIYAHADKKYFYGNIKIDKNEMVKYQDIEQILNILYEHLNIISIDYNQRAYSHYPSSLGDLKYLLEK